jgi:hypothetical protein
MKYQAVLPLAPSLSRKDRAALVLEILENPLALEILSQPENQRRLRKLLKLKPGKAPATTQITQSAKD